MRRISSLVNWSVGVPTYLITYDEGHMPQDHENYSAADFYVKDGWLIFIDEEGKSLFGLRKDRIKSVLMTGV